MSGGSYNYLYSRFEADDVAYDVRRMGQRLQELGYTGAASATLEILRLAASLKDVWQAVEWADSGDWDVADVREAVAKVTPVPVPGTKHDPDMENGR